MTQRKAGALLLVAVMLVAMNLRMTITAVGPLLDQIGSDLALSVTMLGLLGSLPLLLWGALSPLSHWIGAKLGMSNAVAWALVCMLIGTIWRSSPWGDANLWAGTALIGFGLAVSNVLMPAIIKRDFADQLPLVMGLYTALLSGMAAIGSGIAVPISHLSFAGGDELGWRIALLAMGAPLPIAILVWAIASRGRDAKPGADTLAATSNSDASNSSAASSKASGRRVWRDPVAWQVSIYMGSQSTVFYSASNWFVAFQISNGVAATTAGIELMAFLVIGLCGSLLLPLFVKRDRLRPYLPALIPAIGLIAWVGMPLAPTLMPLWLLISGLIGGASLTLAISLTAMRARTAEQSSALSGMAQSVGYLIAATGPILFGFLLGTTGSWILAFSLIWVAVLAQLIFGWLLRKPRYVLDG